MRIAINKDGEYVEVSNDTPVDTIDGIHYLLTPERITEEDAKSSEWNAGVAIRETEYAVLNRRMAYEQESDPIFFKYQRDEATKQEWIDKITEIRNRFPK